MPEYLTPSQAKHAAALPNMFIDIGGNSQSSLTGSNIDSKLQKTDQVLQFSEELFRDVNPATINNFVAAGALWAGHVEVGILRTKSSVYVEKMLASAQNIENITFYRAEIINNKLTITEEIVFKNCQITAVKTRMIQNRSGSGLEGLDTISFEFRFLERQHNMTMFDQTGRSQGQDVSLLNFQLGTLQSSSGGGGDSGGGDSGDGDSGGDSGGGDF